MEAICCSRSQSLRFRGVECLGLAVWKLGLALLKMKSCSQLLSLLIQVRRIRSFPNSSHETFTISCSFQAIHSLKQDESANVLCSGSSGREGFYWSLISNSLSGIFKITMKPKRLLRKFAKVPKCRRWIFHWVCCVDIIYFDCCVADNADNEVESHHKSRIYVYSASFCSQCWLYQPFALIFSPTWLF